MLSEQTLPVSLKYRALFSKANTYIFVTAASQEESKQLRSLLLDYFPTITTGPRDALERTIDEAFLFAREIGALGKAAAEETALAESYVSKSFEMMPQSDSFLTWCTLTDLFNRVLQSSAILGLIPGSGLSKWESDYAVPLMKVIANRKLWDKKLSDRASDIMMELTANPDARTFLKINRKDDVYWFSRERYGDLVFWIYITILINTGISHRLSGDNPGNPAGNFRNELFPFVARWMEARDRSDYQVDKLLSAISRSTDD